MQLKKIYLGINLWKEGKHMTLSGMQVWHNTAAMDYNNPINSHA